MRVKQRKFLVSLAVFCLVAYSAQGNYGVYLGYEMEGEHIFADGVTLHYTDQGAGEPVILLHGFAMNSDVTWRLNGTIDYLAERYRVIAMDLRGHGLSAKPYASNAYGTEMARDVARLMDALAIPKAHVVGNSLGGLVAIKFAAMYPDRTLTLTSCGMGWARYAGQKQEVAEALAKSLDEGDGFGPLVRYLMPEDQPIGWMEMSALNALVQYANDEKALAVMTRQLWELEVSESDLASIAVPVLSVAGGMDPMLSDIQDMAEHVKDFQSVVVDDADHFNLTERSACAEAIRSFLDVHSESTLLPLV